MAAEAKKNEGNDMFKASKFDKALELYTEAIELDSSNHLFYSNRAACYLALDKNQQAKDDCEKCLAIDPTFVKAYLRKATAMKRMGELEEALVVISNGMKHCQDGGKNTKKTSGLNDLKRLQTEIKRTLAPKTSQAREDARSQNLAATASRGVAPGSEEHFAELQARYEMASLNHAKIRQEMQRKDYEIRRNNTSLSVLNDLGEPSEIKSYKQVGRMFIQRDFGEIVAGLQKENEGYTSEMENLKKGLTLMDRQVKEAKEGLQEMSARA